MRLDGGRHRGRGLAGADDDRAALRPRRQMRRHAQGWRRGVHRRVEHGEQQAAMIDAHGLLPIGFTRFRFRGWP